MSDEDNKPKTYEGPVSGGPMDAKMLSHSSETFEVVRHEDVSDNFVKTVSGTYSYVRKEGKKSGYWRWDGWR